jgi:hypothetical protein
VSASFVTTVRAKGAPVTVASTGGEAITIRVQVAELWDVVRVDASTGSTVAEVKRAALTELVPGSFAEDYVAKFRGWEILDENATLAEAQLTEGSILLLHVRRRLPVK